MDEVQGRALRVATIVVASFGHEPAASLTPEDQKALQDALEVLAGFSGRRVAEGFVEWQRCGCNRRQPGRVLNVVPAERSVRPRLNPLNLKSGA